MQGIIPGGFLVIPGHSWWIPGGFLVIIPSGFLMDSWSIPGGFLVIPGGFLMDSWSVPGGFLVIPLDNLFGTNRDYSANWAITKFFQIPVYNTPPQILEESLQSPRSPYLSLRSPYRVRGVLTEFTDSVRTPYKVLPDMNKSNDPICKDSVGTL